MDNPAPAVQSRKMGRSWLIALILVLVILIGVYLYFWTPFSIPIVLEEGSEPSDLDLAPREFLEAEGLLMSQYAHSLRLFEEGDVTLVTFRYQDDAGRVVTGTGRVGSFTAVSTLDGDIDWSPDLPGRIDPNADVIILYNRSQQLPDTVDVYRIFLTSPLL